MVDTSKCLSCVIITSPNNDLVLTSARTAKWMRHVNALLKTDEYACVTFCREIYVQILFSKK